MECRGLWSCQKKFKDKNGGLWRNKATDTWKDVTFEINIASLKARKEAPWVEGGGRGGGVSQPSQDFSIRLCWVVAPWISDLWNVAHGDEEEPFVCAIHNFDQFCPNEEVTLFWKRARFLSQVLVHCTQYPSLCSFTRALLSTSAISGLCASSFQQFILLCPSWQKVKDLFENKKSKLSSFWEMSFKVFWEYWRWEKES